MGVAVFAYSVEDIKDKTERMERDGYVLVSEHCADTWDGDETTLIFERKTNE